MNNRKWCCLLLKEYLNLFYYNVCQDQRKFREDFITENGGIAQLTTVFEIKLHEQERAIQVYCWQKELTDQFLMQRFIPKQTPLHYMIFRINAMGFFKSLLLIYCIFTMNTKYNICELWNSLIILGQQRKVKGHFLFLTMSHL